jgi:chemotaxis protein methyltransferase CheR
MAFTYFFRDLQTLELITKQVLPVLQGAKYINIWDAGCAHGPEPFSLAIMLRESMSHFLFRTVTIHATDVDGSDLFGKIIAEGVYPEGEIQRIPEDIRNKYFATNGKPGHYVLSDEIRARVTFTRHDLLSLKPVRTGFSLVMCKNVLLHFSEADRCRVIQMFHDVLHEGGFLVTEQTQKLPDGCKHLFQQISNDGQAFQKK